MKIIVTYSLRMSRMKKLEEAADAIGVGESPLEVLLFLVLRTIAMNLVS